MTYFFVAVTLLSLWVVATMPAPKGGMVIQIGAFLVRGALIVGFCILALRLLDQWP